MRRDSGCVFTRRRAFAPVVQPRELLRGADLVLLAVVPAEVVPDGYSRVLTEINGSSRVLKYMMGTHRYSQVPTGTHRGTPWYSDSLLSDRIVLLVELPHVPLVAHLEEKPQQLTKKRT